jgi:hypothetical protein
LPENTRKNGMEETASREAGRATAEGNPLKAEAQGRYRHERRLERRWTEQSVKRLRKPEDAAQPDEANPVWVAVHIFIRRRARNPRKGRSRTDRALRHPGRFRANARGTNSGREANGKRGVLGPSGTSETGDRETAGSGSRFNERPQARGGSTQPIQCKVASPETLESSPTR